MKNQACVLFCMGLLLAGLASAAPATEKMMVESYLVFDNGQRIDYQVPLGESLTLENKLTGEGFQITPRMADGEVEFQVVQLQDGVELIEAERVALAPGQEQLTSSFVPFTLGFQGLAPAGGSDGLAEKGQAMPMGIPDPGEKHCGGCGTYCNGYWVSCTVCTSGWCCSIYCNGNFVCRVCHT